MGISWLRCSGSCWLVCPELKAKYLSSESKRKTVVFGIRLSFYAVPPGFREVVGYDDGLSLGSADFSARVSRLKLVFRVGDYVATGL